MNLRDDHHTVMDMAIEVVVIYGYSCSRNHTVNAQSTLAMALTVTFMVVMAIHMAVCRADEKKHICTSTCVPKVSDTPFPHILDVYLCYR